MFRKALNITLASLLLSPTLYAQGAITSDWTHSWGGPGTDGGNGVATDSAGDVYVAGSTTSYGGGGQDVLLLKYDSSGNQVWAKTWGGPSNDFANSILLDSSGNIYVVGGTESFGAGSDDVLILKFDSSGNLVWARTWGGSSFDVGYDLSFDQSGNLAIAAESYSFGNCTVLLKMNTDGAVLSTSTWKGPATYDSAYSITVDASGNTILTGISWDYSVNPEHNTILVQKYDAQGNLLWNRNWAGPGEDETDGRKTVRTDAQGNIFVAGRTDACSFGGGCGKFSVLLLKIDPTGNLLWSREWAGATYGTANALWIDSKGNLFVVGSATGLYGDLQSALIQNYDTSGNLSISRAFRGSSDTAFNSISSDAFEDLIATGTAVNVTGVWQDTGIPSASAPGSLSTPTGAVNSPTGSIGTPLGTVGAPTGITDAGGGGEDAFTTSFTFGASNQTGTISVATNVGTATFTVTGPQTFTGSGASAIFNNAPAGAYTITFGAVAGYITPSSQSQTLAAGETLVFTGGYNPVSIAPNPVSFPDTYVGGTSPVQYVTVTNGSGGAVTMGAVTVSPNFAVNSSACVSILAGNSCRIPVRFRPGVAGPLIGTLTINEAIPVGSQAINLSGNGLNLVPKIASLNPSDAPAGATSFIINVHGSYFISTSTVQWNGADRVTTFLTAGHLQAQILSGDINAVNTAYVTVTNPTPGGGTSNKWPFAITAPQIAIVAVSPSSGIRGGTVIDFTVQGDNFQAGSQISFSGNSSDFNISYVSIDPLRIVANIAIASNTPLGVRDVVVTNPDGQTARLRGAFTVRLPSFTEAVQNGVATPQISGGQINATFRPNFGLTLKQAAQLGGYDHFNWVQVITEHEGLAVCHATDPVWPSYFALSPDCYAARKLLTASSTFPVVPFFDVPPGGFQYQVDICSASSGRKCSFPVEDNLPWYGDEKYTVTYQLAHGYTVSQARQAACDGQTNCTALAFEDAPDCHVIPYFPCTIRFTTALVGVKADGSGDALNTVACQTGASLKCLDIIGTGFKWHVSGGSVTNDGSY